MQVGRNFTEAVPDAALRDFTVGRRIRRARLEQGRSQSDLAVAAGVSVSAVSMLENGKRHIGRAVASRFAAALQLPLHAVWSDAPLQGRDRLELALLEAQNSANFRSLGLAPLRVTAATSDATIRTFLGVLAELERRDEQTATSPEQARLDNTRLRHRMLAADNYLPEIERLAEEHLAPVADGQRALGHRTVRQMAERLGYTLVYVDDLPRSTRSITDKANKRIYLPPASTPGGHGLRAMALQAVAHLVLQHQPPESYARFLEQRLEINYFAACCLMPEHTAVPYLQQAKQQRALAVEDFRDAFGVTHEAAALRMTNLLTSRLDLPVHFLRVGQDGALYKGYANDGLPLPMDASGSIEGQVVCRRWGARTAVRSSNRTTEHYQITETPQGTFWCSTQTASAGPEPFTITLGTTLQQAKYFTGSTTQQYAVSSCPSRACCKLPSVEDQRTWSGNVWPSARLHAHVFAPLPAGQFPGVDDRDVIAFLNAHAGSGAASPDRGAG